MEIDELPFDLSAVIGNSEMSLSTYHRLCVGDILLLDQQVGEPIVMKVGETPFFRGRPGLSETRKAVRINERIHN